MYVFVFARVCVCVCACVCVRALGHSKPELCAYEGRVITNTNA